MEFQKEFTHTAFGGFKREEVTSYLRQLEQDCTNEIDELVTQGGSGVLCYARNPFPCAPLAALPDHHAAPQGRRDILTFGEESAASMGVNTVRAKQLLFLCAAAPTGSSTGARRVRAARSAATIRQPPPAAHMGINTRCREPNHRQVTLWQMGSFSMRSWSHLGVLLPFLAAGLLMSLWMNKELDILTFDGLHHASAHGQGRSRGKGHQHPGKPQGPDNGHTGFRQALPQRSLQGLVELPCFSARF